ncbi:hypothetical protein D1007_44595 [Hordeum vulgare]|nr:hypothetical protein D1007_44595 [Hordeum vulgare]
MNGVAWMGPVACASRLSGVSRNMGLVLDSTMAVKEWENLPSLSSDGNTDTFFIVHTLTPFSTGWQEKFDEKTTVKKILQVVQSKSPQIAPAIEQFGNFKMMTVKEVMRRLKVHEA